MAQIKNSISIDLSIDKVFNFLSNPEHFPLWNYYIKTVHKISSGTQIIGSRYRQVRRSDEQIFEISGFQINKFLAFKSDTSSYTRYRRQMFFSEAGGKTLIEDNFELVSRFPSFILKLFSGKTQKAIKENLEKLKELLETGQTVLQDGRVSKI